jgi:hypothetical protein
MAALKMAGRATVETTEDPFSEWTLTVGRAAADYEHESALTEMGWMDGFKAHTIFDSLKRRDLPRVNVDLNCNHDFTNQHSGSVGMRNLCVEEVIATQRVINLSVVFTPHNELGM